MDAFSMKTLSVLVWQTEGLKASKRNASVFTANENALVWMGPENSEDNKKKWKH